jgi:hypothetical protein
MRRMQFGIVGSALSVLALGLFLAGCSKEKDKEEAEKEPGKTKTTPGPQGATGGGKLVEGKGTGTLKGKITVKGEYKAELDKMTAGLLDAINKKPDARDECLKGSEAEKTEQVYRIGANKQVGNVVVWLMPANNKDYFKIDDKQVAEAKAHPLEIDQPHCAFLPHVSIYFPSYVKDPKKPKDLEPTGQKLIVNNTAAMSHNTNWKGSNEPDGNELIPSKQHREIQGLVPNYREPLSLKCTIHGWMNGYVWIFGHPYAAVSKSDTVPEKLQVKADDPSFGTYEIKGAPAGVPLRVVAWHENNGFLTPRDGKPITLNDGDNTQDFELEVKP